jgi:hypothetical protein
MGAPNVGPSTACWGRAAICVGSSDSFYHEDLAVADEKSRLVNQLFPHHPFSLHRNSSSVDAKGDFFTGSCPFKTLTRPAGTRTLDGSLGATFVAHLHTLAP